MSLLKNYVSDFNFDVYVDSLNILKILHDRVRIRNVYSSRLKKLRVFCKTNKIYLNNIKSKIKSVDKNTIAIACGVSKIFKKNEINKYSRRIVNIHFGDLPKYRGRHPLTWAILRNEKKVGCTIHLINEKIDQGYILKKFFVKNNLSDNSKTIEKKIINLLGSNLISAIGNLRKNKLKKIERGRYYPPLYNGIKLYDSKFYNREYLICALKAQYSHGGIQLNKKKYKNYSLIPKKGFRKFICLNNRKIFLK